MCRGHRTIPADDALAGQGVEDMQPLRRDVHGQRIAEWFGWRQRQCHLLTVNRAVDQPLRAQLLDVVNPQRDRRLVLCISMAPGVEGSHCPPRHL